MEANVHLGTNITLTGFRDVGPTELVVVRKLLGNHARRIAGMVEFDTLNVNLKEVHGNKQNHSKYDLRAKLSAPGKVVNAEVVDYNLYVGLDNLLKKVETQIH